MGKPQIQELFDVSFDFCLDDFIIFIHIRHGQNLSMIVCLVYLNWLNASSFQRFFERSFQRSPTSTLLSRLKQAAEAGRSGQLFRALDV